MTPPISLARQLASRANGARSKGPVTPEGKLASSRNSTRHGMLSQTIVLEGESNERFEAMLAAFTADYQPANESETSLVENLAITRWRQMRVWSIEKAAFDIEMAQQPRSLGSNPIRAAHAFKAMAREGTSLNVAHRYETSFDRQFTRTLRSLQILLDRRKKGDQPTNTNTAAVYPDGASRTWATWDPDPELVPESVPEEVTETPEPASEIVKLPHEPNAPASEIVKLPHEPNTPGPENSEIATTNLDSPTNPVPEFKKCITIYAD